MIIKIVLYTTMNTLWAATILIKMYQMIFLTTYFCYGSRVFSIERDA
jgi:hypothetical protein